MKACTSDEISRLQMVASLLAAAVLVGLLVLGNRADAQSPASGKSARGISAPGNAASAAPSDIGQCRLEEIVPSQEARRLSTSSVCRINAPQAVTLLAKSTAMVIDPRAAHELFRSRIRNSVPMSLSELRRRPDLRSASLVVIGNGKDDATLFDQCAALRDVGYKNLSVLAGGLNSWQANGGEVIADQHTVQALPRLSARELLQRVVAKDATILLAPESKGMTALVRDAIALPSVDAAHIAAGAQQGRAGLPVVIVSASAPAHDLLSSVSRSLRVPVFSYVGERADFETVLRQHLALWERSAGGQRLKCPGL